MSESRKAKCFVWVLSLTLGPVLYCVPLLAVPRTLAIEAIKDNFIDQVAELAGFWAAGFVLVSVVYWSSKFMVKYGPFV